MSSAGSVHGPRFQASYMGYWNGPTNGSDQKILQAFRCTMKGSKANPHTLGTLFCQESVAPRKSFYNRKEDFRKLSTKRHKAIICKIFPTINRNTFQMAHTTFNSRKYRLRVKAKRWDKTADWNKDILPELIKKGHLKYHGFISKVFYISTRAESTLQISVEVNIETLPRMQRNRIKKWGKWYWRYYIWKIRTNGQIE